jgi:hypothetical protein
MRRLSAAARSSADTNWPSGCCCAFILAISDIRRASASTACCSDATFSASACSLDDAKSSSLAFCSLTGGGATPANDDTPANEPTERNCLLGRRIYSKPTMKRRQEQETPKHKRATCVRGTGHHGLATVKNIARAFSEVTLGAVSLVLT